MKSLADVVVDRILYFMNKENLNQYKLAQKNDIPFPTIKSIMQRRTKTINLKTIILLAKGFGVTPSEFIDLDDFLANNLDLD